MQPQFPPDLSTSCRDCGDPAAILYWRWHCGAGVAARCPDCARADADRQVLDVVIAEARRIVRAHARQLSRKQMHA